MTDATEDIPEVDHVSGTGIPLRGNDIDTDQVIPARFMKVVTFDGLGEFAFFDQRFDDEDNPKDHPMNEERFRDASVMVVNSNFGCGSSREHAPQALMRWGIDALIGESFAEIFAGNCLALGIPTVTADHETIDALQRWVDDTFYWEVRVVPTDSSGISYVAFVNAESSDVTEVETRRAVSAFMRGERAGPGDGDGGPDDRTPTVVVQRVAPNGTVVGEMEIYGNESVRVVQGNRTGN